MSDEHQHLGKNEILVTKPIAGVIGALLTAVIIYFGSETIETSKNMAVLTVQMESIQKSLNSLSVTTGKRYTNEDAQKDWLLQKAVNTDLFERVRDLENKFRQGGNTND